MKFSERSNWPLAANPLSEAARHLRQSGRDVLDLTLTNPTRAGFRFLNPDLLSAFSNPANLDYNPDPLGLPRARQALAHYYQECGLPVSERQILLTAGTSEAYSFLFRLLANPGDRILAPKPSYPLLEYLTDLHDLKLERYALEYQSGRWQLPAAGLKHFPAGSVRAVLSVHPNNPTGHYVNRKDAKTLADFCRTSSCAHIVDEVFYEFPLADVNPPPPLAAMTPDVLTFTLGGISKLLGLPQMKLSWMIVTGPEDAVQEAMARLEVVSDTFLSIGTPVQNALPVWLEKQKEIAAEIRDRISSNEKQLRHGLKGHPVQVLHTEGGWSAVLQMPATAIDEEWALDLLQHAGVLTYPGFLFDFDSDRYLVVSLLTPREDFESGIRRVAERLK